MRISISCLFIRLLVVAVKGFSLAIYGWAMCNYFYVIYVVRIYINLACIYIVRHQIHVRGSLSGSKRYRCLSFEYQNNMSSNSNHGFKNLHHPRKLFSLELDWHVEHVERRNLPKFPGYPLPRVFCFLDFHLWRHERA